MTRPYKYLPSIPKPLLDELVQGNIVPIIGAGFSKNADIPDGITVPDWNELAEAAAMELSPLKLSKNPIDVLSAYEHINSRNSLVNFLMRQMHIGHLKPGNAHKAFCNLFGDTVCTTNFDFLLEEGYRSSNLNVAAIVNEDRLSVRSPDEVRVIKLHGDFNHPERMVISEKDYSKWAVKNPLMATYLANLFITRTILLIGYSLDDPDIRTLRDITSDKLGGMARKAYCIAVGAPETQTIRYEMRNVQMINLEGDAKDYKTILCDLFLEMKRYIEEHRNPTEKKMEADPNVLPLHMYDVAGFCIGDTRHHGCYINHDESSDTRTVATIDFSKTKYDTCSIVYYITEERDWSQYHKEKRKICFEISSDSTETIEAEIEPHLLGRNIRVSIDVPKSKQAYNIPLTLFTKTSAAWSEITEICFLFRKENIKCKTKITVENLRIE